PLLLGFIGNGEIGLARQLRVDLDEVGALALEFLDGFTAFLFVSGSFRTGPDRLGAVDDRPGCYDARTQKCAPGTLFAPLENALWIEGMHVTNPGDAVREEEREELLARHVYMHVPKSWNQELAGRIHDLGIRRHVNFPAFAERGDAVAGDHHCSV